MGETDETTARLFGAVAFCICGAFLRVHTGAGPTARRNAIDEFQARHAALAETTDEHHHPTTEAECRRVIRQSERPQPTRLLGVAATDADLHDPDEIDRTLGR